METWFVLEHDLVVGETGAPEENPHRCGEQAPPREALCLKRCALIHFLVISIVTILLGFIGDKEGIMFRMGWVGRV